VEIENYEHGRPSWVDLASPDIAASSAFYGGLFGWDTPPGPPEMGGYVVATVDGKPVAGIGPKMDPNMPTVWTTYVNVDDADATAAAASGAGGQVLVAPMDIPEAGRMAIVADPTGAVIGIWQPNQHRGAQLVNEPSAWVWAQLFTTDLHAAEAFYTKVFGWGVKSGEGGGPSELTVGENTVASMMLKPAEMPADVPPHWHVYFGVSDIDVALARIAELGGTAVFGPVPMDFGPLATAVDPAGASFSIVGMAQAA